MSTFLRVHMRVCWLTWTGVSHASDHCRTFKLTHTHIHTHTHTHTLHTRNVSRLSLCRSIRELIEETLTGKGVESICNNWSTIQEEPSLKAMMGALGLQLEEGDSINFACKGGKETCNEFECEMHISGEEFGGVENLLSSVTPVYAGYGTHISRDTYRKGYQRWCECTYSLSGSMAHHLIYSCVRSVDDPRNTDNAWMESFVLGWLVDDDDLAEQLNNLPGGSDSDEGRSAADAHTHTRTRPVSRSHLWVLMDTVAWWPIHKSIPKGSGGEAPMLEDGTLFASHSFFLRAATDFILNNKENLGFANEAFTNEAKIRAALKKGERVGGGGGRRVPCATRCVCVCVCVCVACSRLWEHLQILPEVSETHEYTHSVCLPACLQRLPQECSQSVGWRLRNRRTGGRREGKRDFLVDLVCPFGQGGWKEGRFRAVQCSACLACSAMTDGRVDDADCPKLCLR